MPHSTTGVATPVAATSRADSIQPPDPARPTRDQHEPLTLGSASARLACARVHGSCRHPAESRGDGGRDDGRRPRAERQRLARRQVVDGEVLVDTGVHPQPVDGHVGEVGRDGRLQPAAGPQVAERLAGEGVRRDDGVRAIGRDLEQAALGRLQCPADAGGDALVALDGVQQPAPRRRRGLDLPEVARAHAPGRGDPASGRRRPTCGCGSLVRGAGARSPRRRRRGRRRSSRRRCPPARQGPSRGVADPGAHVARPSIGSPATVPGRCGPTLAR